MAHSLPENTSKEENDNQEYQVPHVLLMKFVSLLGRGRLFSSFLSFSPLLEANRLLQKMHSCGAHKNLFSLVN